MKKILRLFDGRDNKSSGKSISPTSAFLIVSILFGIAFVFITPPFQVPDEENHFLRSYQVSEGGLFPVVHREPSGAITKIGGVLPESLVRTTKKARGDIRFHSDLKIDIQNDILSPSKIPLNAHVRAFVSFTNIARYPFVPYVPQAVGILFGRLIGLTPLLLMYLGRLANLAAWIFLIYSSIRIIPTGKWVLFLAAVTPMSLFIGASLSGDTPTNGLSFLFIALMMRYGTGEGSRLILRERALIFGLAVLLALCRPPYFLVVFLFLMVPYHKMGSRMKYWTFFGFLVLLVGILNIGWNLMTDVAIELLGRPEISPHDQIRFILADPLNYVGVMLRTLRTDGFFIFVSHFGVLGWLDTYVPVCLLYLYALVLMFTAVVDGNEGVVMRPFQRITICAVFMAVAGAIATAPYVIWTPVGAPIIHGIQGRYLIACLPLFYLAFNNRLIGRKVRMLTRMDDQSASRILGVLLTLFAIVSSALALWKLVVRYYI